MKSQKIKTHEVLIGIPLAAFIIYCAISSWNINEAAPENVKGILWTHTLQTFVFIITGIVIYFQLRQNTKQQHLNRLVAWKASIQSISEAIAQKPALYVPILYGPEMDTKEGEKLVATYACMHAIETIYHMRKDEEPGPPPTELTKFLTAFVTASPDFKTLWSIPTLRPAFTKEFQNELIRILGP